MILALHSASFARDIPSEPSTTVKPVAQCGKIAVEKLTTEQWFTSQGEMTYGDIYRELTFSYRALYNGISYEVTFDKEHRLYSFFYNNIKIDIQEIVQLEGGDLKTVLTLNGTECQN